MPYTFRRQELTQAASDLATEGWVHSALLCFCAAPHRDGKSNKVVEMKPHEFPSTTVSL